MHTHSDVANCDSCAPHKLAAAANSSLPIIDILLHYACNIYIDLYINKVCVFN